MTGECLMRVVKRPYAAEIPQQAVKGKFSEIIKKITGREEIEALAAISLDSFGFCPAELFKKLSSMFRLLCWIA